MEEDKDLSSPEPEDIIQAALCDQHSQGCPVMLGARLHSQLEGGACCMLAQNLVSSPMCLSGHEKLSSNGERWVHPCQLMTAPAGGEVHPALLHQLQSSFGSLSRLERLAGSGRRVQLSGPRGLLHDNNVLPCRAQSKMVLNQTKMVYNKVRRCCRFIDRYHPRYPEQVAGAVPWHVGPSLRNLTDNLYQSRMTQLCMEFT